MSITKSYVGKKCIVRDDRAGVFFGEIVEESGRELLMKDVRRIWYWDGAASLSQLAMQGTNSKSSCKFPIIENEKKLFLTIEIIPCTDEAIASIEGVKVWTC